MYRVVYSDEMSGTDVPVDELGAALMFAWRQFEARRSSTGSVRVISTYIADRVVFEQRWSLEDGFER